MKPSTSAPLAASALATVLSLTMAMTMPMTASAEPVDRPKPTSGELAASIDSIDMRIDSIDSRIDSIEPRIENLDEESTDGEETVISLASDILFDFGKSELPANARPRLAEIIDDVPQDATVRVEGHTDSIGAEDFNQQLSEDRAEAVAAVLREARPDLTLEVRGFGLTQPIAPNTEAGEDNPEGRAQNRRVEIRFDS